MTHRATALGSATVLLVGITGLAGPAAASPMTLPPIIISEFGIDMDAANGVLEIDGTFVELENVSPSDDSLDQYTLEGCNTTTGLTPLVTNFTASDFVLSGGHFLIANSDYDNSDGPPQDRLFESSVDEFLERAGGGLSLTDTATGLSHNVRWGDPHFDCAGFPVVPPPTADESAHFARVTETWTLGTPTPISS